MAIIRSLHHTSTPRRYRPNPGQVSRDSARPSTFYDDPLAHSTLCDDLTGSDLEIAMEFPPPPAFQ